MNTINEFHFFKVEEVTTNENIPSREESLKHRRASLKRKSNVKIQAHREDVTVQWDKGKISGYNFSGHCLRLFDNGPSGNAIKLTKLAFNRMY